MALKNQVIQASNIFTLSSDDIKLSVILYLKRIIKASMNKRTLTAETALEILKSYIDIILSNTLNDNCLNNLSHCLQELMDYKLISENRGVVSELVKLIEQYVLSLDNIGLYKNVLPIIENIVLSSSVSQYNAMEIFGMIFIMIQLMMDKVIAVMGSLDLTSQGDAFVAQYLCFINKFLA